jgi:hydroxybutyrate-dimer hydrolase
LLQAKERGAPQRTRSWHFVGRHKPASAFPGFNDKFVPLHHYFVQALDLMLDRRRNGTALPPSQVVRATPRGPGAPPIGPANLPPIAPTPDPGALIACADGSRRIPE